MPVGTLTVELQASIAKFQEDLGKAAAATETAARQIKRNTQSMQAQFDAVRSSVHSVTTAIATISGGTLTVAGIVSAFEAVKAATIESEQSIFQLNAALKATQGAAGLTVSDLNELGRSIKSSTVFSTEDITKAETALLRFRDIRKEVFEKATASIPDLAVALGIALPEAAAKLGRALEDPTKGMRGLKEAGVALSESQLALAIHFSQLGDKAQSQKIILDAVAASTSGAALAATQGLSGATDKLARSLKDLQTAAGKKLFGENHDLLVGLQGVFERLTARIDESGFSLNEWVKKFTAASAAVATGGASLGILFGSPPDTKGQRTSKGIIGGQDSGELSVEQDKARQAALDADIARRIDARTILQFNALKSFAEKSASFYASDAALQKHYLTSTTAALEFSYAQGEIATADYYGTLATLAKRSFTDQDQIFTKRVQAEEAILKSQFSTEADRSAASARLVGIVGQADTARLAVHERLQILAQQEVLTVRKLADEYGAVAAEILDLQGKTLDAAKIRIATQDQAARRTIGPNPAALAQRDDLTERLTLQAKFNQLQQDSSNIYAEIAIRIARIDLAQEYGGASELQTLAAKSEAGKSYINVLRAQAEAALAVARAGGNQEQINKAEEMKLKLDQLAASADILKKKFDDVFTSSLATFFEDIIGRTKSLSQAVRDMAKSIEQSITKLIAEDLSKRLYKSIFGGGDGGGFDLGSFFAKLLGTAAPSAPVANFGAGDSFGGGLGGFAIGTDYVPRDMIAKIHQGEAIVPAALNKPGGKRGHTFNITVNALPGVTRESASQAAAAMGIEIRRALAREM